MFSIKIFVTAIFLHIIDIGTTTPASDLRTFVIPGIVSASVVFFICVACIAIKQSISGRGRRRPHTPPIPGEDEHTGGHNSAGALSQTEESSGGDDSEYLTPRSTITSVQDEPLSMTDPAVACKNNNTNKEIQSIRGRCRRRPHEATPLIHGEDEHTGGHNSAGALSQTEESSGGDDSEYWSPRSTITSVQDEPLSMTDPAVACKNNNTNKEIQGSVRKDSHETEEAKV